MLVISRKNDESIRFPGTGIEVRILKPGPSKVRVGVKAPPDVSILRGELDNRLDDAPIEDLPVKSTLIVDDNQNELRLLASYLKLKRMQVDTAENGEVAVNHLVANSLPDVVLLDLNMPEFDGAWTVSQLRSNPETRDLKIIAVSGSSPQEMGIEIGPEGVDAWYAKPLNPEQLFKDLNESLPEVPC